MRRTYWLYIARPDILWSIFAFYKVFLHRGIKCCYMHDCNQMSGWRPAHQEEISKNIKRIWEIICYWLFFFIYSIYFCTSSIGFDFCFGLAWMQHFEFFLVVSLYCHTNNIQLTITNRFLIDLNNTNSNNNNQNNLNKMLRPFHHRNWKCASNCEL